MVTSSSRVAAAVAAATVVAACGSGPRRASGSAAHPTQARLQQDLVAFAGCMRSHGVPRFPDPSSPRAYKTALGARSAQSPAFQSARAACRHLVPGGEHSDSPAQHPERVPAELAFARCLRTRGFPRFPDPTSGGELTHEMVAHAGIDPHAPTLLRAADACVGVTHGAITRADVARFGSTR